MEILMYGRLADVAGAKLQVDGGATTVAELREQLAELHPALGPALSRLGVRACIGDTIVPENHPLAATDEVEFFPPVSGG